MPLRYWSQSISVQSSLRHHSRTGSAVRRGSERVPERRTSSSKRFAKSRQWQLQRRAKEKPRVTHPPRGCYNQQDSSTKIPREANSRTFHGLKAGISDAVASFLQEFCLRKKFLQDARNLAIILHLVKVKKVQVFGNTQAEFAIFEKGEILIWKKL